MLVYDKTMELVGKCPNDPHMLDFMSFKVHGVEREKVNFVDNLLLSTIKDESCPFI